MTAFACFTCGRISKTKWCENCSDTGKRPSPKMRGYHDAEFLQNRAILLHTNPTCIEPGCTNLATIADHRPTRKRLIANGVANPDAIIWLFPVCDRCHNSRSAKGL